MRKKLLIILGVVISVGILAFGFFSWQRSTTEPSVSHPDTPGTRSPFLPPGVGTGEGIGGSTTPYPPDTGGGTDQGKAVFVTLADGRTIRTRNFLQDPRTFRDPVNAGRYQLGYQFTLGDREYPPYIIEYIEATDLFSVVLLHEPIAESRREAERFLMGLLSITEDQMCGLRYVVSVPTDINQFYASRSLGFSFCQESVQISE